MKRVCVICVHLGEVGGLAGLVLGDLVHRVLGALLALAVGPPLLGNVHHLRGRGKDAQSWSDVKGRARIGKTAAPCNRSRRGVCCGGAARRKEMRCTVHYYIIPSL